jgi:hypothetical protein
MYIEHEESTRGHPISGIVAARFQGCSFHLLFELQGLFHKILPFEPQRIMRIDETCLRQGTKRSLKSGVRSQAKVQSLANGLLLFSHSGLKKWPP